ncbi:MAG: peptide-methionine (S)-S-oxide reductase MsrA [Gemmatimonadales bacterium]
MIERATLGGGCFWCVEAVYEQLRGVTRVTSGYAGGHTADPTYREVCSGDTGHAEVIQIEFDPGELAYRDILEVFFTAHDPTTLNRQGDDVGTQYRSVILYESEEQQRVADELIAELEAERVFPDPVVTEVGKLDRFYPAEEYHTEYFRRNSDQPYCQFVIAPKLAKFREKFRDRLKEDALRRH